MIRQDFKESIALQIKHFTSRERKMKRERLESLVCSRILHGWAFTGQSREDHDAEVRLIKIELASQMNW